MHKKAECYNSLLSFVQFHSFEEVISVFQQISATMAVGEAVSILYLVPFMKVCHSHCREIIFALVQF